MVALMEQHQHPPGAMMALMEQHKPPPPVGAMVAVPEQRKHPPPGSNASSAGAVQRRYPRRPQLAAARRPVARPPPSEPGPHRPPVSLPTRTPVQGVPGERAPWKMSGARVTSTALAGLTKSKSKSSQVVDGQMANPPKLQMDYPYKLQMGKTAVQQEATRAQTEKPICSLLDDQKMEKQSSARDTGETNEQQRRREIPCCQFVAATYLRYHIQVFQENIHQTNQFHF